MISNLSPNLTEVPAHPRFITSLRPAVLESAPLHPTGMRVIHEWIVVSVRQETRYVAVAYLTNRDGSRLRALVRRPLFARPHFLSPTDTRSWADAIDCATRYPKGLTRELGLLMKFTREWVQAEAAKGWRVG